MLDKFQGISNPLTVIAIFAGFVEVGGTIVLPFLSEDNQTIYLWWLMGFPTLLITAFFVTLNFNHTVLYAPKDYREDASFMSASRIQQNKVTQTAPVAIHFADPNQPEPRNIT